jgi:hypothetical protein
MVDPWSHRLESQIFFLFGLDCLLLALLMPGRRRAAESGREPAFSGDYTKDMACVQRGGVQWATTEGF